MKIAEAKKRLVALALGQVGYCEGANNYNKYAEDSRITALYGWNVQNQPWCCVFVNWLFLQLFDDIGARMTYGGTAACNASANLYKQNAAWKTKPEVGDQIFFFSGGGINHTGIVVDVQGKSITTVEGNCSDKVSKVSYTVGDPKIAGYGRPDWNLVEDVAEVVIGDPVDGLLPKEDHALKFPLLQMSGEYKTYCVLLQGLLNARHFACGEVDGFYGPKTQCAVNKAQKYFNLEVDGICGPKTWAALWKVD